MSETLDRRMMAVMDGEFVVFLIGIRINKIFKLRSWLPVFLAMPKMLRELSQEPARGLLHSRLHLGFPNSMVVQYWRSFAQLEAYAKSRDAAHLPAWQAFNKAVGTNGDVGIWHETYLSGPGQYETIYVNMPPYGLGRAGTLVSPDTVTASAAGRLRV